MEHHGSLRPGCCGVVGPGPSATLDKALPVRRGNVCINVCELVDACQVLSPEFRVRSEC